MNECYQIYPVGIIRKSIDTVWIEIYEKFHDALLGLDDFSHITVCYWFDKNDTPEQRKILQVYPRKNKKNPLRGVFATHSQARPNLIAISICKIISIKKNIIYIDKIDAFDKSPVIDIKCFIPSSALKSEIKLPDWLKD